MPTAPTRIKSIPRASRDPSWVLEVVAGYFRQRADIRVLTAARAMKKDADAPRLWAIGVKNGIAKARRPVENAKAGSWFFPALPVAILVKRAN